MVYQNGKIHRNNLPAIICGDGKMQWYKNGIKQKEGEIDGCNIKAEVNSNKSNLNSG